MTLSSRLAHADPDGFERIHLIQGECRISADPKVVFTTTLGSCIAACLYDPTVGVGGMNHFLLPDQENGAASSLRYGAYAMELLINALMRAGASRRGLEAKLFGGGRLSENLTDIGDKNATFAEHFLEREGIRYGGGSLRGAYARKVQFWPATGRARQLALTRRVTETIGDPALGLSTNGSVELF